MLLKGNIFRQNVVKKKIHAQPDAPLAKQVLGKQVLGKLGFEVGFYFSSGV